jgi:hypothetical protein
VSYRCGIYGQLAAEINVEPGPPRVTCDRCGTRISIRENRLPPKWLLDGKAPPGWQTTKHDDGTRTDLCKACRPARAIAKLKERVK